MPGQREPAVTVLMSVYNDYRYLRESVGSILGQSFTDFELVIVNDGSTDESTQYIRSLSDRRVRVLHNPANVGLARSLNRGLSAARGQYIARMDADDIAAPHRLARQVEFLDEFRGVGIVGSDRALIDDAGQDVGYAAALPANLAIRWKLLLGNPFTHPAVMLRRSVLQSHQLQYDPEWSVAQDYELWVRLLAHTRAANINEPLLWYRLRGDSVSGRQKVRQLECHDAAATAAIRRFAPTFDIEPPDTVRQLRGRFGGMSVRESSCDSADPTWLARYLELLAAFAAHHAAESGIHAFVQQQREHIMAGITYQRPQAA